MISSTGSRISYPGAGSAGPFAYTFRIFAAADLRVTKRTGAGDTTLTYITHYTVSGVGNANGSITLLTALAVGETLVIRRAPSLVQPASFQNQGAYFAKTHEDEYDRLLMQIQSVDDVAAHSLRLPETFSSVSGLKPQAGKVIGYNGTGTDFETYTVDGTSVTLPAGGRTVSTLTAFLSNNAVLNVKDFGAVGDGVTDDTAAIQLALTSIPATGRHAVLMQGIFKVTSQLSFTRDNFRIVGPGRIIVGETSDQLAVFSVSGRTNVWVEDIEFHINGAARVTNHAQTQAYNGAGFSSSTECGFVRCKVKETYGFGGSATGLTISGGCTRCAIISCTATDLGVDANTNPSDAFFVKGTQCLIVDSVAQGATDTGFVLEECDYSGIIGCTALDCAAPAAITNAGADAHYGNFIDGLTSRCNYNGGTGAIAIGCLAAAAGDLVDTIVNNLNLLVVAGGGGGTGPGIRVTKSGAGKVKGLIISNSRIRQATAQGIVIEGSDDVEIAGCRIEATALNSAIQVQTGCTRVHVIGCYLKGGAFGIGVNGTSDLIAQANVIRETTDTAIAAADTSTVTALMNVITTAAGLRTSRAAGATLNLLGTEGGAPMIGATQFSAAPAGSLNGKVPAYDSAGVLKGYIPTYDS